MATQRNDRLRLVLVGCDDDALDLARAVAHSPDVSLVAAYDVGPFAERLLIAAPRIFVIDDWLALLAGKSVDGVIVASSTDDTHCEEILRRLVQQAVPLLLVQPACESIVGLELDMIRGDTACPMTAYFPGSDHPAIGELAASMRPDQAHRLGHVDQLVIERSLVSGGRRQVLADLARDAALVRRLAGPIDKVSALGASSDDQSLQNLSVNMTTSSGVLCRWSVVPDNAPGARLTVIAERGKATLSMPRDTARWRLQIGDDAGREYPDFDAAAHAVEKFAVGINKPSGASNWTDACRDLEVVASVEESLRRSRTIPIYDQQPSEEQTFKGMMAAGGCGVLMLALVVLLVWAVVEGLRMPRQDDANQSPSAAADGAASSPRMHILLRLWPVYPLAIFLLLQLFWLVFPRRQTKPGKEKSPSQRE